MQRKILLFIYVDVFLLLCIKKVENDSDINNWVHETQRDINDRINLFTV